MYNSVFKNPMKNVRKHKRIKSVTTEERRDYLVSELNYHTIIFFLQKYISHKNEKNTKLMNKLVYLGLSMLEMSKTVMHEFWYDYVKPKYGEKVRLYYMATHCKRCWY